MIVERYPLIRRGQSGMGCIWPAKTNRPTVKGYRSDCVRLPHTFAGSSETKEGINNSTTLLRDPKRSELRLPPQYLFRSSQLYRRSPLLKPYRVVSECSFTWFTRHIDSTTSSDLKNRPTCHSRPLLTAWFSCLSRYTNMGLSCSRPNMVVYSYEPLSLYPNNFDVSSRGLRVSPPTNHLNGIRISSEKTSSQRYSFHF